MTALIDPARAALLPPVRPLRSIRPPAVVERTLANGLRVLAARRANVPRCEARLVVPVARGDDGGDPARLRVLAKTLLAGTSRRDSLAIASELQRIGGDLEAAVDAEDFVVYGSALAPELPALLALLGEVLSDATHPAEEVGLQRARLGQELRLSRSQPQVIAGEAFRRRIYGRHPYGRPSPSPERAERVSRKQVLDAHGIRLRPEGALLVLVGDLRPATAIDEVEAALGGWSRGGAEPGIAAPGPMRPGPIEIVHRPGAVQTNIRIGGPAVNRSHADYPKLALANLVFGGYFVSRLVDNIREDKGYTYSPGSVVQQQRAAAHFVVHAEVATEVTGPSLVEIRYELERMLTGPIREAELVSAKRYLTGTLSMAIQTQAGLAGYLSTLAAYGLPVEYVRDFPAVVERLDEGEVIEAARSYMAPRRLTTVLVGDGDRIAEVAGVFGPVEVVAAPA